MKILIVSLLIAASSPVCVAQAQTDVAANSISAGTSGTFQQFFGGDLVPLDLKFSQMQSGWSRVQIERKGETVKAPEAPTFVSPDPLAAGFKRYFGEGSDAVWTQGRTVNLNGAEQLVIYRAQFPTYDETEKWFEARMPSEMKSSQPLEPERQFDLMFPVVRQFLDTVPIRASLVNVSEIASMRDVEPFGYERALAALENDGREQLVAFNRSRNQNRQENSRASLQMLAQGFKQYLLNYDDTLPPLGNWDAANKALQPYIRSEIKLAQPEQEIHTNARLSSKKLAHLQSYAQSLIVFYSDPDQDGNRWVVFLNGNIEVANQNQWPQLKKASRLP